MPKLINEKGNRYGRLVVLKREGSLYKQGYAAWRCRCDCGNEAVVSGDSLRSENTQSCGCIMRETLAPGRRVLPYGECAFNQMLRGMKRNAKTRGLKWNLTEEQVKELTKCLCHYCGAEPAQICKRARANGDYVYNGLDRIDSGGDYTIDNVVPCCGLCNRMKWTLTQEEFVNQASKIYRHFIMGAAAQ